MLPVPCQVYLATMEMWCSLAEKDQAAQIQLWSPLLKVLPWAFRKEPI